MSVTVSLTVTVTVAVTVAVSVSVSVSVFDGIPATKVAFHRLAEKYTLIK